MAGILLVADVTAAARVMLLVLGQARSVVVGVVVASINCPFNPYSLNSILHFKSEKWVK